MLRQQTLIVFDGQSLNNEPQADSYSAQVMAARSEPWCNVAKGGNSWTVLALSAPGRLHLLPGSYARSILVLTGGYADIVNEGNSGAVTYADQQAYASAARSAGFDRVIAVTMTHGTATSAPDLAEIDAYNTLIRDDQDGEWDALIDFASSSILMNPFDSTYFSDGIHWTPAGAAVAAGMASPIIADVITSLES